LTNEIESVEFIKLQVPTTSNRETKNVWRKTSQQTRVCQWRLATSEQGSPTN
jgi:hypothetical protein